jgi:hypothetical protein
MQDVPLCRDGCYKALLRTLFKRATTPSMKSFSSIFVYLMCFNAIILNLFADDIEVEAILPP